jgi:predicted nucleotidyltransferase
LVAPEFGGFRKMVFLFEQKMPRDKLVDFCKRNYIKKLSVFGSAIHGQLGPESDIDLLVEFEEEHTPGLFSIVRMEMELAEMLGRKVDLRTPEDLSRYFRDEVIRNAQVQYQA